MITYTEEEFNEAVRLAAAKIQELQTENGRLSALLAEACAAFDAGDVAKLTAMREAALKTDKQKALDAALAEKAAAEAKIAELSA